MDVPGKDVVVKRPVEAPEVEPGVEVEREWLRVVASKDIVAERAVVEHGEHKEASRIISG